MRPTVFFGWWQSFCLIAAMCLITGCVTHQEIPVPAGAIPDPSWRTATGQLRYQDSSRSLIGEAVLQWSPPRPGHPERWVRLEFSKSGVVLLKLTRNATTGYASGPLAGRPYQGPVVSAPARLAGWFAAPVEEINRREPPSRRLNFPAGPPSATATFTFQLER